MKRWIVAMLLGFAAVAMSAPASWAAEAAGADAGEAKSPLYPVDQGLITGVVTIVIFVILIAVLGKYAWGPIVTGLKAREDKIRKDIADAEAARAKAEAILREYNQQLAQAETRSRDILSKANSDAQSLADQIRARAQQEAEEARERATRDIDEARKQALRDIYEQAATLSTTIAEKILRRNLNADDQRDLVAQSLEQLQAVNRG